MRAVRLSCKMLSKSWITIAVKTWAILLNVSSRFAAPFSKGTHTTHSCRGFCGCYRNCLGWSGCSPMASKLKWPLLPVYKCHVSSTQMIMLDHSCDTWPSSHATEVGSSSKKNASIHPSPRTSVSSVAAARSSSCPTQQSAVHGHSMPCRGQYLLKKVRISRT